MFIHDPHWTTPQQLNGLSLAISSVAQHGVDPRGSKYALGLVKKAQGLLVDQPGWAARGWMRLFGTTGADRKDKATELAQTARQWLEARGVVPSEASESGGEVCRGGIRQPLTLGQKLRDNAITAPLFFAQVSVVVFPTAAAECARDIVGNLRRWPSLKKDERTQAAINALGLIATPVGGPVLLASFILMAALSVVAGPLVGTAVALSQYSRGGTEHFRRELD